MHLNLQRLQRHSRQNEPKARLTLDQAATRIPRNLVEEVGLPDQVPSAESQVRNTNVLLVSSFGPVWYTIYHHLPAVSRGVYPLYQPTLATDPIDGWEAGPLVAQFLRPRLLRWQALWHSLQSTADVAILSRSFSVPHSHLSIYLFMYLFICLFDSILFYSILFCSILFYSIYSILFYSIRFL